MKSVVICGSRRFKPAMRKFAKELKALGVVVFEPYLHDADPKVWSDMSDEYKQYILLGLTHDHFYKIRMADVVYVFNEGGYSGVSTTLEIGHAAAFDKPIYALSNEDPELSRAVLFREIIKTPRELVKRLK